MPKMKTHSGAKKRFSLTATGKVKRGHQNKSHILSKKPTFRTRRKRWLKPSFLIKLNRRQENNAYQKRS